MVELIGKFRDFALTPRREALVTFAFKTDIEALESELNNLSGKELSVKFGAYSPKRSLSANAYFHVLCREIGKKVGRTETFVKNDMIAHYGQPLLMENGDRAILKSNLGIDKMWELEDVHTKSIKADIEKGKPIYFYALMRKTSDYDSKEMSFLIDNTVREAQDLGIPTISDEEVKRLLDAWATK